MSYTVDDEKELNADLKLYQNKFKRLINGEKWDSIAESIHEGDMSIIRIIMNAKSYKDVSWIVMYNVDKTLDRVRNKYHDCSTK